MAPEGRLEPESWLRLRELFAAAALLDPGDRTDFLDRNCADDPELRRELESLLAHDAAPQPGRRDPIREVVAAAAPEELVEAQPPAEANSLIGQSIGNIRVLRRLGRGGMGNVYVGFDESLQRRVALKSIRARYRLAAQARARFLREARILSQLEHPNICRIHEYVEGDDRDFLVLELIEGTTLSAAISEGLEPARKLRAAIQIAEVLKAAHGKGVVHRDLKPQNVMITPAGEIKVLDFGLARSEEPAPATGEPPAEAAEPDVRLQRLTESSAATQLWPGPGAPQAAASPSLQTRHGQVLGTPVYMSPEQANGEAVTTASDMYSFGLVLQKLFTGRSPYPGGLDSFEILARASRADTRPVSGIDKDLAALIERLKSAAPAERPTAVATLDRLRWIRDKPKRRLRRLIAAGIVALVALAGAKYTWDLKVARDEATARRSQAEGLLGFMLEDLRTSLEPLGRLDLLDAVGDRAMDYFAAAPGGSLTDEELSRQAQALTQIGEVRTSQLRYDEALAAFVQAYERAADLSDRQPEDGDRLFDRGQAEFWVGNTHLQRSDFDGAREWFQRYLDTCVSLLDLDPGREDWVREVAYGHHNMAVLSMELGGLEAAKVGFLDEVAVLTTLLEWQPANAQLKEDLADAFSWLGSTHRRRADLAAAARAFEQSSELFAELVAADPANERFQFWRAFGRTLEARIAAITDELEQAEEMFTEGLDTLDRLVAADPGNRHWRRVRAGALVERAQVIAARGRAGEALHEVVGGGAELAEVLAVEATDRKALRFRIRSWWVEAALRMSAGETAEAGRALSHARGAAAGALTGADARDPLILGELASTLVLLGELASERGDPVEADGLWQEAISLVGDGVEDTTDPDLLDPWIRSQVLSGRGDRARPVLERLTASGYRPWRAWPAGGEARGKQTAPRPRSS